MRTLKFAAIALLPFVLAACEEPGPLERAGEEIDEAIEDVRNGGETLPNRVDDAIDDVRDGIDDAREELQDR